LEREQLFGEGLELEAKHRAGQLALLKLGVALLVELIQCADIGAIPVHEARG